MRLSPKLRRLLVREVGEQLAEERNQQGPVDVQDLVRQHRLIGTAHIGARGA